jgi:hypothetical protein
MGASCVGNVQARSSMLPDAVCVIQRQMIFAWAYDAREEYEDELADDFWECARCGHTLEVCASHPIHNAHVHA